MNQRSVFRSLPTLLLGLLLVFSGLAQNQTAPHPNGNWFTFAPQTAKNTLSMGRFKANWLQPQNRVLIQGFGWPFTNSVTDGLRRFTNGGFTHAERPQFLSLLNLPVSKRFIMARDADAQGQADAWWPTLPDSDPRKQHIRNYAANQAVTSSDYTIYRELGRRTYYAVKGIGVNLIGFDIESFAGNTPVEAQHGFQVQANLGVADAIAADAPSTRMFQYGGSLAGVINYTTNRQDDDKYFRIPGNDWIGGNGLFDIDASALTTYYRTSGAFVGRDQYARRTWDDRSLFQKNGDGSIKLDGNGKPLFVVTPTGTMQITNFGKTAFTTGYESYAFLQMFYEEADKILTDWRWLCNTPVAYDGKFGAQGQLMPYPKGTVDIRPGLENLHLCGWYRDDTESEGIFNPYTQVSEEAPNSNNRPLNPRAIRYQMLMRTLFYHGNILWSDKAWMGYEQGKRFLKEGGGQYVEQQPLAMGQYEHMLAGHYQASQFPKWYQLFDTNKAEFIIPKRFVNHGNDAIGEWEVNKPIVWGIKEQGGKRVGFVWCYPVQDVGNVAHEMDIKAWVVLDNGQTSGSYVLHCKDRNTALDMWQVPAGFEGAKPENWRFQFTSPITGQTFTWTGNYNVPFVGSTPTPPAPITRTTISNGAQASTIRIPFAPQPVQLASAESADHWSPFTTQPLVLGMAN